MSKILDKLLLLLKNRLFLFGVGVSISFGIIVVEFYEIQVLDNTYFTDTLNANIRRTIDLPSIRGTIYDRNGKAIALNQSIYALYYNFQEQVSQDDKHRVFIRLINILESNGDALIDEVPISHEAPFVYTSSKEQVKRFLTGVPCNTDLEREELANYTADELLIYLKSKFKISDNYSIEEIRKLIGIEYKLYGYSYQQYKSVKLSNEISKQTVVYLQEQSNAFPGISVQSEAQRTYPYGEALSSVLGYTGKMTNSQYEEYSLKGYSGWEDIGQMGIEKSLEDRLRGVAGMEIIEVNQTGQRVVTLETQEPTAGENVYLTLDANLQLEAYNSLEKRLSEALVERLLEPQEPLTSKEILLAMIRCNSLNVELLEQAPAGSVQNIIYKRLIAKYHSLDSVIASTVSLKDLLLEGVNQENLVTEKELLLALNEQKTISLNEQQITFLKAELETTTESLIIQLLKSGSLKPSQIDLNPSSGAVVVINVNTGEVLSQVSYPTYDSNKMVGSFNTYWQTINEDSRSLLWNRSIQTLKAPGSTFKMLTAIAGLEEGVITPDTEIFDEGEYKNAGSPYPKCWLTGSRGITHGQVNLKKALEVSCNYYFYEVAMRLEALKESSFDATDILTFYGNKLGLGSTTGIELDESAPYISNPSVLFSRKLKAALDIYQAEDAESRENRIQKVIKNLKQELLKELPLEIELEPQNSYGTELATRVEPLVQEVMQPIYKELLSEIYLKITDQLNTKSSFYINEWVNQAISYDENDNMDNVIKQNMITDIERWTKVYLDRELAVQLDNMNKEKLLDVYETIYTKIYRQLIREEDKIEAALVVKEKLDELKDSKFSFSEDILLKIRQNMINIIVNDLLNGVELKWSNGITVRSAIGQGENAFSPVQIARYIAAIANGEYTSKLTLIKGICQDAESLDDMQVNTEKVPLGIKKETIKAIHEGMLAVTSESNGTAYAKFKDLGISVAAKTGTAEEGSHAHSWFAGFAPAEKPEIAIVVTLYNTDHLGSYGQDIAKDVLSYYFKHRKKL